MQVTISKTIVPIPPPPTPRVCEVACMFGLSLDGDDVGSGHETEILVPPTTIALRPGEIIFITGPSGAGKSTMLALIEEQILANGSAAPIRIDSAPADLRLEAPLIEHFSDVPLNHALAALSCAGLAEAPILLRPSRDLSDGQRARFHLARTLSQADRLGRQAVILADEFAATLDRLTAHALARSVRKWISRSNHTLIAATTHDDLLESLDPDVLVHKRLGRDVRVLARRR